MEQKFDNFGKDIRELSEEELFRLINNKSNQFAVIAQYELMRRLSTQDSESSKRNYNSNRNLSIVAITIALITFGVQTYQTYLAKVPVDQIWEQQNRVDRNIYESCKEPGNWDIEDGGATPGSDCKDKYLQFRSKFGEYIPAEKILEQ